MVDEAATDRVEIARSILRLYRRGLTARAIAHEARVGERTVRRHVKALKLWEEGLDEMAIEPKCDGWSLDQVRFVIGVAEDEDSAAEKTAERPVMVDPDYLSVHRRQLATTANTLLNWSGQGIATDIRDPLRGSWPAPLDAAISAAPVPPFRVDPLFDCLIEHLEGLALGIRIERISEAWVSYVQSVRELLHHVRDTRSFNGLDETIELGQIEMGLGAIGKPDTDLIRFHLEESPGGWRVRGGAFSQVFDKREDAEHAAAYANQLPELVTGSISGLKTIRAQDQLIIALKNLAETLADHDLVEHAIFHSTCARCGQATDWPAPDRSV